MKVLCLLLCVCFATLAFGVDTYTVKRGGSGFNVPSRLGSLLVGVGGSSWVLADSNCELDLDAVPITLTCGAGGGLTIQEEGSDLTTRSKLNFIGSLVTCVDNPANSRTNCTFLGDGVGYDQIQDEASNLTKRATVNFIGTGITCVDDAGNLRTNCTVTNDGVGYDEVLDEASSLTKRAKINFIGSSISCVDNAGALRTDCTLTSDGVGYDQVQDEGSNLTKQATINFIGANVTCVNNGGSSKTDCTFTPAPPDASYVTMALNSTLSAERVLTAGSGISITDGGANGNATIALSGALRIPCDERYDVCFFDDMNHRPDDSTATGGITNANAGPWAYRNSGTNAIAAPVTGGATVASGGSGFNSAAYRFDTGSSTGGEACFITSLASPLGAGNQLDTTPRGKTAIRFAVRTGQSLGSVSDRFYFMIGANNSGSCNNTDTSGSVIIELLYADLINSGKWQGIAKSAAGTSTCDTGVTVATDTAYKGCLVLSSDSCTLDVYVTSTFSALDCVDPNNITGSPQCTITGNNIPGCNNAGGAAGLTGYIDINKTAGTNVRVMFVDYYGFYQHSDTAR